MTNGLRSHDLQSHNLTLYQLSYSLHIKGRLLGDSPGSYSLSSESNSQKLDAGFLPEVVGSLQPGLSCPFSKLVPELIACMGLSNEIQNLTTISTVGYFAKSFHPYKQDLFRSLIPQRTLSIRSLYNVFCHGKVAPK